MPVMLEQWRPFWECCVHLLCDIRRGNNGRILPDPECMASWYWDKGKRSHEQENSSSAAFYSTYRKLVYSSVKEPNPFILFSMIVYKCSWNLICQSSQDKNEKVEWHAFITYSQEWPRNLRDFILGMTIMAI